MNSNPDPSKHKDIPVWNAENWFYGDIDIGKSIRSIRGTISEGESMQIQCAGIRHASSHVADEIFAGSKAYLASA